MLVTPIGIAPALFRSATVGASVLARNCLREIRPVEQGIPAKEGKKVFFFLSKHFIIGLAAYYPKTISKNDLKPRTQQLFLLQIESNNLYIFAMSGSNNENDAQYCVCTLI